MTRKEVHKEIGRLISHYSSLQFEKDVTHVRNQDVIVKEMKIFYDKIHDVIDDCILNAHNHAIDEVLHLIEDHEEEVFVGVVNDILNLKK